MLQLLLVASMAVRQAPLENTTSMLNWIEKLSRSAEFWLNHANGFSFALPERGFGSLQNLYAASAAAF